MLDPEPHPAADRPSPLEGHLAADPPPLKSRHLIVAAVLAALVAAVAVAVNVSLQPPVPPAAADASSSTDPAVSVAQLVIVTEAADGTTAATLCSGMPLAGTDDVVTAAHCFGAGRDRIVSVTARWADRVWVARTVRIHAAARPTTEATPAAIATDAAVVTVAAVDGVGIGDLPGAVRVATTRPGGGEVEVRGWQYPTSPASPLDGQAVTCRASSWAPALRCGLGPGASGGPWLVDGVLVGVTSAVGDDSTGGANVVVPRSAIAATLDGGRVVAAFDDR